MVSGTYKKNVESKKIWCPKLFGTKKGWVELNFRAKKIGVKKILTIEAEWGIALDIEP